jgi:hypothetical protein
MAALSIWPLLRRHVISYRQGMDQRKERPSKIPPQRNAVLAGPKAAGLLGWDGFDPNDPAVWLVPRSARSSRETIRTKFWEPAVRQVDGYPIACDQLVLSYLLVGLRSRPRWENDSRPLSPTETLELGVEFLLRNGYAFTEYVLSVESAFLPAPLGRRLPGVTPPGTVGPSKVGSPLVRLNASEAAIRDILVARGRHEPPTESYLETRTVQQLRRGGFDRVFRQVPLRVSGRIVNRIDLVVAAPRQFRRPPEFASPVGVPIEADGREFHADTFEKDRRRANHHSIERTQLLVVTHNMVEREPREIIAGVERILSERVRASKRAA